MPKLDPGVFYHPADVNEVTSLIKQANAEHRQVRVCGSAHSVNDAIFTSDFGTVGANGINLVLDKMISVTFDDGNMEVTADAGCHLGKDPYDSLKTSTLENSLTYQLQEHQHEHERGWALCSTGGIIHQTVGGFISTGSAGGTLKYSLIDDIRAIDLVDGNGESHHLTRDNPEFYAAGVSLGLLGVITSVTFKCHPTFNIEGTERTFRERRSPVDLFEDGIGSAGGRTWRQHFQDSEYARCIWWPQKHVEKIVFWSAKRLPGALKHPLPRPYQELRKILGSSRMCARLIGFLMRLLSRVAPPQARSRIGKVLDRLLMGPLKQLFYFAASQFLSLRHPQQFEDTWSDGLPMDNKIPFDLLPTEFSEMMVDLDRTGEVMRALRDHYRNIDITRVGCYSVEIYAMPKNQFWLSPAYEQDVVKIDFFWFTKNFGNPDTDFYPQFWTLLKKYDCRFHWGKHMPADPTYLAAQYPKWNEFLELRQQMDPNQIFVTDYWRQRLDIPRALTQSIPVQSPSI